MISLHLFPYILCIIWCSFLILRLGATSLNQFTLDQTSDFNSLFDDDSFVSLNDQSRVDVNRFENVSNTTVQNARFLNSFQSCLIHYG